MPKTAGQSSWDDEQVRYWNGIAPVYDTFYQNPWSAAENFQTLDWLRSFLKHDGCAILDLGCGTGLGYSLVGEVLNEFRYVGLDISAEMVRRCHSKHPEGEVFVRPMTDLSVFVAEEFDYVISLYTAFSFANGSVKALEEIRRVLKPGGGVFLSVLNRWALRRWLSGSVSSLERYATRNSSTLGSHTHAHTYGRRQIKSLMKESGFQVEQIWGHGVLAGVCERESVVQLDMALSHVMPWLVHLYNVVGYKDAVK